MGGRLGDEFPPLVVTRDTRAGCRSVSASDYRGKRVIAQAGWREAYDQKAQERLRLAAPTTGSEQDTALVFEPDVLFLICRAVVRVGLFNHIHSFVWKIRHNSSSTF